MKRSYIRRKPPRRIAKRKEDREYLAWVHTLGCCSCRSQGAVEANHVGPKPGMGLKCPDRLTVPQCSPCHRDWTDHVGVFRGLNKASRRAIADCWLAATRLLWEALPLPRP